MPRSLGDPVTPALWVLYFMGLSFCNVHCIHLLESYGSPSFGTKHSQGATVGCNAAMLVGSSALLAGFMASMATAPSGQQMLANARSNLAGDQ